MTATVDSVDEARAKMGASVEPLGCEPVALPAALNRILREAPSAARDQPPFASSAMDGFAVRVRGSALRPLDHRRRIGRWKALCRRNRRRRGGTDLHRCAGSAGCGPRGAARKGAPRRRSALDRRRHRKVGIGAGTRIEHPAKIGANIRAIAIDFKAGEQLIGAGNRLNPGHIALLAAAGIASVKVSRAPRIALLATGTEIIAPGEKAGPHQIYDSVTFGLGAMIEKWGGFPVHRSASPDEDEAISGALLDAIDGADLAVIAGGASVGDYDVVKRALASRGLEVLVRQVAVRPGKPTWFGTIGSKPVLGLPGNPAAAFVCAHLFLRHLINRLLARDAPMSVIHAVLDGALRENPVESYLRAHASVAADARWMVRPFDNQDTSLVSVFAAANALIRRAAGAQPAARGAIVEAVLLDSD